MRCFILCCSLLDTVLSRVSRRWAVLRASKSDLGCFRTRAFSTLCVASRRSSGCATATPVMLQLIRPGLCPPAVLCDSSHRRHGPFFLDNIQTSESTTAYWQTSTHLYDRIMDVAVTAVGVASLGIQVCQGLPSYYDSWKNCEADINGTHNAIIDLSKTLILLRATIQRGSEEERAARARCVKICDVALPVLEEKLKSLRRYSRPGGLRQKLRSGLQRSLVSVQKEDSADAESKRH